MDSQIQELHQTYCRLTGQNLSLRFDRERLWYEFLRADFTERDLPDTPQVVIVNQALARKYWPNDAALGKRVSFSSRNPKWYEIVGVVGNVKHRGLDLED